MRTQNSWIRARTLVFLTLLFPALPLFAGDADITVPSFSGVRFGFVPGVLLLYVSLLVCAGGAWFGWKQFNLTRALPTHPRMAEVSNAMWENCKTHLLTHGKLLALLWALLAACLIWHFGFLSAHNDPLTRRPIPAVMVAFQAILILWCSAIGAFVSFGASWIAARITTEANSRTAFSALKGNALETLLVALRSGVGAGTLLVSAEVFSMICIFAFLPQPIVGPGLIAFAIGESLGTIVMGLGGRSTTADILGSYGISGAALTALLALALAMKPAMCATLIIWLFAMRVLSIATALGSAYLNERRARGPHGNKTGSDFTAHLRQLAWMASLSSIVATYAASWLLLGNSASDGSQGYGGLWWVLASFINCGTIAGASAVVFANLFNGARPNNDRASTNIRSGFAAGHIAAFWKGLATITLMFVVWKLSLHPSMLRLMPSEYPFAGTVIGFGLVAFGFLCTGTVTIALDSSRPAASGAHSVLELSQIESLPNIDSEIQRSHGFLPNIENAKRQLEKLRIACTVSTASSRTSSDAAALIGATTMIFGIILFLDKLPGYGNVAAKLSLVQPEILLGLLFGGAAAHWLTGEPTQTTPANDNIAGIKPTNELVKTITPLAQKGVLNIFGAIASLSLALPLFSPYFFIAYAMAMTLYGLLHVAPAATFSSAIKFTTLFGMLAVGIATQMKDPSNKTTIGGTLLLVALVFIYRSISRMPITGEKT